MKFKVVIAIRQTCLTLDTFSTRDLAVEYMNRVKSRLFDSAKSKNKSIYVEIVTL